MRIIVGISGASGVVMGYALLKALRAAEVETHLVVTEAAERTLACETALKAEDLKGLADAFYDPRDIAGGGRLSERRPEAGARAERDAAFPRAPSQSEGGGGGRLRHRAADADVLRRRGHDREADRPYHRKDFPAVRTEL